MNESITLPQNSKKQKDFNEVNNLCPDCDHGLRGGKPCQSCEGLGIFILELKTK